MDIQATIEVLLETVFYTRSMPRSYKEDNWGKKVSSVQESVKKTGSWKRAVVQRGLEPGSRGLAIVRGRIQATINEGTAGWKRLVEGGNQRWRYN
jgi:hypothetical protein